MKTLREFLILLAGFVCAGSAAFAHPVAQGSMNIEVLTNTVHVRARVSAEEALVANTFASGKSKAGSLPEVWQRHGDYLLEHIRVITDERRLAGKVLNVEMSKNDFIVYELEYPVAATPRQLRVEQDVLNEIEFAPGNPWEATYVVSIAQHGRTLEEGLLLTRKEPVNMTCNWNTEVASPPAMDKGRLFCQYLRHGIGHILTGYDHLLFVCALVLTAVTLMDLIKVISAFTLAHTITLILSVLNIVRLPSHIVEPMIAGSIVFVALTNVLWPKRSRGNVRIATAFFFGLFHGLGFAGGLLDAMDSMNGIFVGLAITAFSLGVEIGHQMVVLPVFFGLRFTRASTSDEIRRERLSLAMMRVGSLVISAVGTIYLIAALRL